MDKDTNYRDRIITLDNVNYRLLRVIDKTATDVHHIISKKLRNKFNTEHPKNKMVINRRLHVALNSFFWTKQNPRDQLKHLFEIIKPVLSKWVKDELYTILYLTDDNMFYDEDLLKNGNKKKKTANPWL